MRVTVVSPFVVNPPLSGGHLRVSSLNREISKTWEIFQFSQGIRQQEFKIPLASLVKQINGNYTEYHFASVPTIFFRIWVKVLGLPMVFENYALEKANPQFLKREFEKSDLIQVEFPYQFQWVYKNVPSDVPIILDQHNAEFELPLSVRFVKSKFVTKRLIERIKYLERYALNNADVILVVSERDREILSTEYQIGIGKFFIIPNGVDISEFRIIPTEEKSRLKHEMGFDKRTIILFVGSKHPPNFEATLAIEKIAEEFKNKKVLFLVVGGVRNPAESKRNVLFTGTVPDVKRFLGVADIALNPMVSGSGTNIKLLHYLAASLPSITTPKGMRGLELQGDKHVLVSDLAGFPDCIIRLLEDNSLKSKLRVEGRSIVEQKYSWREIGRKLLKLYKQLTIGGNVDNSVC